MKNNDGKNVAKSVAKSVGIVGMTANIALLVLKFGVGFIFKSQGLIADAINSLGDVFSSLLVYIGGKISSKPEDDEHEFGHGKAEFVASLLIGIFMVVVSVDMLYNSIKSVILYQTFEFSWILLAVPIITIITKLSLYFYVKGVRKNSNSILVSASEADHKNDTFVSFGVLIGIVAGYFGYYFVDGIVGAIVSCIICITGIKILTESYQVLIDKCIDSEIVSCFKEQIEAIPEVKHVDSIKSKPTGLLHILIIKISVDPNMTVRDSHKIAGKIRYELCQREDIYDVIVHINPDE